MKSIYWDVETAPLPETDISHLAPKFEAPANYKDPEKIAANLAEQKKAWLERGALSPLTGSVAAIGMIIEDKPICIFTNEPSQPEPVLLAAFWDTFRTEQDRARFIGFNILRFDLPFLMRRSWKLGVPVPVGVRHGHYFSDTFLDLMEVWQLGNREERISLDQLCKYLGVGAKSGSGADFYKLPRAQQEIYLTHDLKLTHDCARKLLGELHHQLV